MMSSVCTLRLNRRRAFSSDSPSCSRTSAKLTHPQTGPRWTAKLLQEIAHKSRRNCPNGSNWRSSLPRHLHSQLHLPGRIRTGGLQKRLQRLERRRKCSVPHLHRVLHELRRLGLKTAICDVHSLIVAVEQVKALRQQLELDPV